MILVYRYGLLAPAENADLVERQMRGAHALRNTLTEIERGRRAAIRAMTSVGDVERLEREVVRLREDEETAARAIKTHRAAERSKSESAEMRAALLAARAATKDVKGKLFAARKAARKDVAYSEIETLSVELRKAAYRLAQSEQGISWGARWLAENAADTAREQLPHLFEKDGIAPCDPHFRRWNGDGQITVQLAGESGEEALRGLAVSELEGSRDTRLRIDQATLLARSDGKPRRGNADGLRTLWIRVSSNEDRTPIWAKFPMRLHRDFPPRAVIKRATVSRRMSGPRAEWSVEFTLDTALSPLREQCGLGACVVHLGWRSMGDGKLRVATWLDEKGESGELVLSQDVIGAIRKPEDLRETRDRAFNTARDNLVQWQADVPAWLRETASSLSDWHSCARLAALARRWKTQRFATDAGGYEPLEAWRYHDHHLWSWESDQRLGGSRYRSDVYRCFAAKLARKYATLVMEDFDLTTVARHEDVASTQGEIKGARSNRVVAAVSTLRLTLEHAFRSRGGTVEKMPAAPVTMTCHDCQFVERFDAASCVTHVCSGCGARWDQDANAAENVMKAFVLRAFRLQESEQVAGQKVVGPVNKWARRREKKEESKRMRGSLAP